MYSAEGAKYKYPLLLSLALHVILISLLLIDIELHHSNTVVEQGNAKIQLIQARVLEQTKLTLDTTKQKAELEAQQQAIAVAKQQAELAEKQKAELETQQKAVAEAKLQAELAEKQKAIAEAKQQAELAEKQKAVAAAKQQAELAEKQKAIAEAKQQAKLAEKQKAIAEAKQQAKLAEKQKAIAEAKQQAKLAEKQKAIAEAKLQEAKRKAQLAAKQKALAEAKRKAAAEEAKLEQELASKEIQEARMQGIVNKYKGLIIQAISQQWIVPPHVERALSCKFQIRIAPGGTVINVTLLRSSGDPILDRSAQTAIYKASPLPVPNQESDFEAFRSISLTVRPEGVVNT